MSDDAMTPQAAAGWTEFFTTAASAAATLVGLVIVAVSVNLQKIIAFRQLPSRAFATIGSLLLVLLSSLAVLMPQPRLALALEILLFSIGAWSRQLWAAWEMVRSRPEHNRPAWEIALAVVSGQAQAIPFVIGGFVLLGDMAGLYWIGGGIFATFIFSMLNGWILLVEIMR